MGTHFNRFGTRRCLASPSIPSLMTIRLSKPTLSAQTAPHYTHSLSQRVLRQAHLPHQLLGRTNVPRLGVNTSSGIHANVTLLARSTIIAALIMQVCVGVL